MPKSKSKSQSKSKQSHGKTKSRRAKAPWQHRARSKQVHPGAGPQRLVGVIPRDGGLHQADDGLYDDCPICQAMRAEGMIPDEDGAVVVDEEDMLWLSLLMREVANRAQDHRAS